MSSTSGSSPHDLTCSIPSDSRPALAALGWDDAWQAFLAAADGTVAAGASPAATPARVTRVDRSAVDVLDAAGPRRVRIAASLLAEAHADSVRTPCVGDWLLVEPPPGPGDDPVAVRLLPRRTAVVRASVTPGASHGQVLAANVDVVLVVEPAQPEPDLGRVERLLSLVWESGAVPVVVLTKADLAADTPHLLADLAASAPGAEVLAVSAVSGAGVADLASRLVPTIGSGAPTVALLGPSGAGKSTLTNALAGEDRMATSRLRGDGKGRHTTVHRELLVLPSGVLLVDTPGLRAVGLVDAPDGLSLAFSDVEELAADCRFGDCAHDGEPGCAVLAAVDDGTLPARRLASWRKLQREARWMASRHDARLRQETRNHWKRMTRDGRSRARP